MIYTTTLLLEKKKKKIDKGRKKAITPDEQQFAPSENTVPG
jgi:hypothetical protein